MTTRREQLKQDLLEHYATKEPHAFYQYDGFANERDSGSPVEADTDGDALCGGTTHELMNGATVRVLVAPGTSEKDALRLLKKIRRWIRRDGLNKDSLAQRERHLDAELCPRCEAEMPGQQGTHHILCRNADGMLTALSDEAVHEALRLLKQGGDDIPF